MKPYELDGEQDVLMLTTQQSSIIKEQKMMIGFLIDVIKESIDYLEENEPNNSITSGSILHENMKSAIAKT